ncbi:MAG: hypothetical protein P5702_10710 [Limnospira sp. PMC 1291.21]|uniref:Uncharacterized protein n=2 Tax=Limnospira TaxID=2596745 RepID=B5W469_LIMMA|nr:MULTISPECIES: hypothetical protein [Limnospira]EKD10894.1 hypothetical protein SPLC1_S051020 [Arthrospira platensis C1]MDC0839279.1 hypothetical protein [Limnoraphis robusta]MDY7055217.1 hypothetical protein [Limnospira fusiformis LS22]QJB27946.1 hypothetical protein HFV01_21905 [Limnospira fusiformis SAG 85.79]RAQ42855.1 hypothetical protein B9S53_12065 [Arthrospira sp. O9.13F]
MKRLFVINKFTPNEDDMETDLSMHTIQLRSYVGSDGLLHISLPDLQDTEVDIILVYQPAKPLVKTSSKRQWSPDFLSVFGAWEGEPLVRAVQEEASERESF